MTPAARYGLAGWIALTGAAVVLGWWIPLVVLGGSCLIVAVFLAAVQAAVGTRQLPGDFAERLQRELLKETRAGTASEVASHEPARESLNTPADFRAAGVDPCSCGTGAASAPSLHKGECPMRMPAFWKDYHGVTEEAVTDG